MTEHKKHAAYAGSAQDLQGMCDPSYAVGIGCLELEQVQQTPAQESACLGMSNLVSA